MATPWGILFFWSGADAAAASAAPLFPLLLPVLSLRFSEKRRARQHPRLVVAIFVMAIATAIAIIRFAVATLDIY